MINKLAQLISIVFSVPILWSITLIFLILKTSLTIDQQWILFLGLFVFQVLIPFISIYIAFRQKKIGDLDITRRKERIKPLLLALLLFFISLIFSYFFGNRFFLNLNLILFILLTINTIITLFWKISFHMATNVVFSFIMNFLFAWSLPLLYITLPLIFWSRLTLKKHTVSQLLGALILNSTIIILFLKYFKYI